MQKLVIALRIGVVVHKVHICLRVVAVHLVVPAHSVCASYETTVYNRQFPVFAVVYLSGTGQYDSQPHGTLGIRSPCTPVALFSQLY